MYSETLRKKRRLIWPAAGGVFGEVNVSLTRDIAARIGQAVALVCKKERVRKGLTGPPRIVEAKLPSVTSYLIQSAFESGGIEMGAFVFQPGPIPLPGLAYLTKEMNADRGVMINGRDGPSFWNGIQIFNEEGAPIPKSEWRQIRQFVTTGLNDDRALPSANETGKAVNIDYQGERYVGFLRSQVKSNNFRGFRVVVDCANGATFKIAPQLMEELRIDLIRVLNASPDGRNINQSEADPNDKLAPVARSVLEYRADIGISLSADGTAVHIYDEKGRQLRGGEVLMMLRERQVRGQRTRERKLRDMLALRQSGVASHEALPGPELYPNADIMLIEMIASEDPRAVFPYGRRLEKGLFYFPNVLMVPDGLLTALHVLDCLAEANEPKQRSWPLKEPLSALVSKAGRASVE